MSTISTNHIRVLLNQLCSQDEAVHSSAVCSLARLGQEVVPILAKTLGDPNANVRCGVALALAKMGRSAQPAVPALINAACRTGESNLIAWALGKIICVDSIPQLLGLLHDARPDIRACTRWALKQIKSEAVGPEFVRLMLSDDSTVHVRSMEALILMQAPSSIPPLIQLLSDANPGVRSMARMVLNNIGEPGVSELVSSLSKVLTLETDGESLQHVVDVMGKDAFRVLKELIVFWEWGKILKDDGGDLGGRLLQAKFDAKKEAGEINVFLPTSASNLRNCLRDVQNHFATVVWSEHVDDFKPFIMPKDARNTPQWTNTAWKAWELTGRFLQAVGYGSGSFAAGSKVLDIRN